jgi:hypothetical protein
MCDGGEAAPRASPRLAEVLTAMIAMLAQGIDQFKQSAERSSDETRGFLFSGYPDDSQDRGKSHRVILEIHLRHLEQPEAANPSRT